MTDIEQKALALWNKVRAERGLDAYTIFSRNADSQSEALCHAIEQHEAFRQEVSDAVEQVKGWPGQPIHFLDRFIIPKLKPDPLVEVYMDAQHLDADAALCLALHTRAALSAAGFEIREKNDD